MRKKIWVLLLVLGFLIGSSYPAAADSIDNLGPGDNSIESMRVIEPEQGSNSSDKLRIIVELDDKAVIEQAANQGLSLRQLSVNQADTMRSRLLARQASLKEEIEAQEIDLDYHYDFVNVMNGFSATALASDMEKIEKLPGVKKVYIAKKYEIPAPQPNMVTSKGTVKVHPTWDLGYKGDGKVVAIIDTCMDPSHKDMRLSNAENVKIKQTDIERMTEALNLPGNWISDKVPYGYNYADNNSDILSTHPHGMHVAGIVGANCEDESETNGIKGVAPETQLLAMKVCSNDPDQLGSAWSDVIVRAMEDSITLGADVINLSMGSSADFVRMDEPLYKIVQRAIAAGVVPVMSAGNSNRVGDSYKDPYAKNPDIGVVGSPGNIPGTISVASVDNSILAKVIQCGEEKIPYQSCIEGPNPEEVFGETTVEYLDCGLGRMEDFTVQDLAGKIALIKRGSIGFVDKIMNAQNCGALGVIVYNNESGGEGLISMAYPGEGIIPAVFIGNHGGEKLRNRIAEGHNQVRFTGEEIPVIGAMSSFTSWGTTPNLDFKPDITAPGGNIYSTIPGDQYEVMSGTSMSSPQVAGGVALILQRMEAEPEMFSQHLNGINRVNMAGHLLMSTARPQEVSEGVEVSPRRQGAGVMDLYAATTTGAIVTDSKTGLSKVNLREIGNTANFSVRVTNFADKERKLRVSGTVLTSYPYVSEGMTYINTNKEQVVLDSGTGSMPISFSGTADGTITVPAGSTADIPVKLDLANPVCMLDDLDKGDSSLKDLNSIFPNGTFVEGFIRLTDLEEKQPELSIPYIGFYGEWDKAPIFDDSLYDEESEPFFGTVIDQKLRGTFVISGDKILGYNNNQMDAQWIAISPNGDEIQDEAQIVTELLRNAREIDVDILDAEGRKLRDLDTIEYLKKNFNLSICEPLYIFPWDGKIDGEVTDGPYIYRLQARVDWDDAKWQTLEFPVRVDTVPPVIESVDYNKDTGSIAVQASDEVFPGVLYHLYVEPRGVLASSIDGVFDLNALAEVPYQLRVMVTDMAGNFSLSEPLTTGTDDKKPVVHLQLPEPRGFYNNQKVTVKGYVEEDNLLASLKLDGNETDFSYNKEENRFEFETTLTIPEGVHDLNIEALDNAGNYSTYQRKLFVDITAPVIQVTTRPPTVVSSGTESVSLAAVIDENMGTLAVIMNGNVLYHKEASPDFESAVLTPVHFEMPLQTVLLEYGDNNILLLAEDGAGNITVRELHVKRMRPEEEQNSGSGGGPGGGSPREEDGSVSGGSTVTVSPGQHGTVSTEGARADVPAAAVGEQVQISVRKLSSTQNLPQRDRLLSGVFEFSKDKSGKFLQPVTIRLAFDRNRIDRERYEPVLCWLDEIRQQWVEVEDCNFDWDNGEVIGRVDHFTKFAVLIRPLVRGVELTDIQGHWARESIEKMINQKVISGYSDGRFLPDKWISRAEFCTILVKYLAVENGFEQPMASFTDTEHHWAKSYIEAAHKAGIVQGYNARTFGPDDPVTREQMTVMLGKAFNIQASDVALTFSDNEKIALWAYPYVAAAVHDKLISGYPDGSFRPQGNTTRAEAVTVLARGMK